MSVLSVLTLFCLFVAVQCPKICTEEDVPVFAVTGYFSTGTEFKRMFRFQPRKPMDIFCRGRSNRLKLIRSTDPHPLQGNWEKVPTEILNGTTVRYHVEEVEPQVTFYMCSDLTVYCNTSFVVVVDKPPDFEDFHCISNNLDSVNCSWSSSNAVASFILMEELEDYKRRVCDFSHLDFNKRMSCEWRTHSDVTMRTTTHLVLVSCNHYKCRNKKYDIRLISIVKLDPPRNLVLLDIGSHFARLQWDRALSRRIIHRVEVDHKVEFWYAGMNFTSANTTSIKRDLDTFELVLPLPCAEQNYEIRVAMKPTEAVGEEYWSHYTTTYFKTTKGNSVNVDPTCGKRVTRETPEVMRFKLEELKDMIISEKMKILDKLREFKARAAKIYLN